MTICAIYQSTAVAPIKTQTTPNPNPITIPQSTLPTLAPAAAILLALTTAVPLLPVVVVAVAAEPGVTVFVGWETALSEAAMSKGALELES
jgi:hypothetical protein